MAVRGHSDIIANVLFAIAKIASLAWENFAVGML